MTTVIEVEAERLVPHPDNPRTDLGEIKELAGSIKDLGVLTPLTVKPNGDDGHFVILAGHRRHAAATSLDPMYRLPVIVRDDLSAEDEQAFLLIENLLREKLVPSEEAAAYAKIIGMGTTMADLVNQTGRKKGHIQAHLKLMEVPIEVRRLVDTEDLSLEEAGKLAKYTAQYSDLLVGWAVFTESHLLSLFNFENLVRKDQAEKEYQAVYDKLVAAGQPVFTDIGDLPEGAQVVVGDEGHFNIPDGVKFMAIDAKAHRHEPCHANLLLPRSYGGGHHRFEVCTEPRKHSQKGESRIKKPAGSQKKSAYEKAVTATAWENQNRQLQAVRDLLISKDKALDDLLLDGVISRLSSDACKAVAIIMGWDKDDVGPKDIGYPPGGYQRLLHEYAAKSKLNARHAAWVAEIASRCSYTHPAAKAEIAPLIKAHGYKAAKAPRKEDFDG